MLLLLAEFFLFAALYSSVVDVDAQNEFNIQMFPRAQPLGVLPLTTVGASEKSSKVVEIQNFHEPHQYVYTIGQ